jgi:hypothetical protein
MFSCYLTSIDPELDRLVKLTKPGMAHWAGTGPAGTTCEGCAHYGFRESIRGKHGDIVKTVLHAKSCGRYFEIMRRAGGAIGPKTPSCRHYQPREMVP